MFQHDIIKRMIEQIAQFIAAAAGLASEGKLSEAEGELDAAEKALGLPRGYQRLDARSIVILLGGTEKAALLADIFDQRAELCQQVGDEAAANELKRKAEILRGSNGSDRYRS
jgi:hypothetical protein